MKRFALPKSRKSLFRILLLGLLGSSLLTGMLVLFLLFMRSELFYKLYLGNDLKRYVKTASSGYAELIDTYKTTVEDLSTDAQLLDLLALEEPYEKPKLYQFFNQQAANWTIRPIVHLLSSEEQAIVSTTFGINRYEPEHYTGFNRLLDQTGKTIVMPNRFTTTNGEEVVMTVGKALFHQGRQLGYVYFDVTEGEVEALFRDHSDLSFSGKDTYVQAMIYTWYRQVLYNKDMPGGLTVSPNSRYLTKEFADRFNTRQPLVSLQHIGETQYLVSGMQTQDEQFVLVCSIGLSYLQQNVQRMYVVVAFLSLLLLVFSFGYTFLVHRSIGEPVKHIVQTMTRFGQGDRSVRCDFESDNELGLIRDHLNNMIVNIDHIMKNHAEKQDQLLIAENNHLKAQIQPHFINNALESIHWLVKVGDKDKASQAIRDLAKLMTDCMKTSSSLYERVEESLAFSGRYMAIQKLCYPDKINVSVYASDAARDTLIPAFLIQPLVENAIVHGLQPKVGSGHLTITIEKTSHTLVVFLHDNGVGMTPDQMQRLLQTDRPGQGIGLHNVHRRLKLYYGDDNGLQIASAAGQGTSILIQIPLVSEEAF